MKVVLTALRSSLVGVPLLRVFSLSENCSVPVSGPCSSRGSDSCSAIGFVAWASVDPHDVLVQGGASW